MSMLDELRLPPNDRAVIKRLRELSQQRMSEARDITKAADEITNTMITLLVGVREVCDTWNVPPSNALALLRSVINSNETDDIFQVEKVETAVARLRRTIDLS